MPARRMPLLSKGWLFLACLAVATAGCGGMDGSRRAVNQGTIPHSAYRPAFDPPPTRSYFLGGYAGHTYGPVGRRARLATQRGGDTWGYPVVDGALDLEAPAPTP